MEVRRSFGDISIVWRVTITLHDGCYRRRLQSRANRQIQLFDDLRWRLGWRKEHAPRTDGLETRQHVLHERHIRERREWLTAGEGEGAHTAVLDQSHDRRRRYKHDFNAATEHASHDFRGPLVGNVLHFDPGLVAKNLGSEMQAVAHAGRAKIGRASCRERV